MGQNLPLDTDFCSGSRHPTGLTVAHNTHPAFRAGIEGALCIAELSQEFVFLEAQTGTN